MLTCKILIVDSDGRDILMESFHQISVEQVHGVGSAEVAIGLLRAITDDEDLPKLIITNLDMPTISGHELLRVLKELLRYRHIPVIVSSTSTSASEAENCLESGARDYITKPSALAEYISIAQKMKRLVRCCIDTPLHQFLSGSAPMKCRA
jgi:CheY-like chemotaxis protein